MGEGLIDAVALKEFVPRMCLYALSVRRGSSDLPHTHFQGLGMSFCSSVVTQPCGFFPCVCLRVATAVPSCLCLGSSRTARCPRLILPSSICPVVGPGSARGLDHCCSLLLAFDIYWPLCTTLYLLSNLCRGGDCVGVRWCARWFPSCSPGVSRPEPRGL